MQRGKSIVIVSVVLILPAFAFFFRGYLPKEAEPVKHSLTITAHPSNSEIMIDRVLEDSIPVLLEPGIHHVVVSNYPHYKSFIQEIDIQEDTSIDVELQRDSISINMAEDPEITHVYIDDQSIYDFLSEDNTIILPSKETYSLSFTYKDKQYNRNIQSVHIIGDNDFLSQRFEAEKAFIQWEGTNDFSFLANLSHENETLRSFEEFYLKENDDYIKMKTNGIHHYKEPIPRYLQYNLHASGFYLNEFVKNSTMPNELAYHPGFGFILYNPQGDTLFIEGLSSQGRALSIDLSSEYIQTINASNKNYLLIPNSPEHRPPFHKENWSFSLKSDSQSISTIEFQNKSTNTDIAIYENDPRENQSDTYYNGDTPVRYIFYPKSNNIRYLFISYDIGQSIYMPVAVYVIPSSSEMVELELIKKGSYFLSLCTNLKYEKYTHFWDFQRTIY